MRQILWHGGRVGLRPQDAISAVLRCVAVGKTRDLILAAVETYPHALRSNARSLPCRHDREVVLAAMRSRAVVGCIATALSLRTAFTR